MDKITYEIRDDRIFYTFRGTCIYVGEFGTRQQHSHHIILTGELRKRYGYDLAEAWEYVKNSPKPPRPERTAAVVNGALVPGCTLEDCNAFELDELCKDIKPLTRAEIQNLLEDAEED